MNTRFFAILSIILMSGGAIAAQEGVPVYYQTQTQNANQMGYGQYASQGYTKYVGQSGQKQVVGTRSQSYEVPRPVAQ